MDLHLKRNCAARKNAALRNKRVGHSKQQAVIRGKNTGGKITMMSSSSMSSLSFKSSSRSGGRSFGSSGCIDESAVEEPMAMATQGPDGRVPCAVCGRKFASDRIAKHQKICRKVTNRKVDTFDVTSQRIGDLKDDLPMKRDMQKGRKMGGKRAVPAGSGGGGGGGGVSAVSATGKSKSNWRQQHKSFIANVRNAKKISAFMAQGGDARDIDTHLSLATTPQPSAEPMVHCPHCSRTFSKEAADRHVLKCKDIVNRPKPPGSGVRSGARFALKRR